MLTRVGFLERLRLFNAEAMVAIEKGESELPAGTPVQFFLLD